MTARRRLAQQQLLVVVGKHFHHRYYYQQQWRFSTAINTVDCNKFANSSSTTTTVSFFSSSTTTSPSTPPQKQQQQHDDGSDDFGYNPGGSTITNKDTILTDVDRALGMQKPPDVEVFLTDHICNVTTPVSTFVHLNFLRFGHIGIRYITSDGIDRVMNINGDFTTPRRPRPRPRPQRRGSSGSGWWQGQGQHYSGSAAANMVNFIPPQEFIFGTDSEWSQQGGVYNRPFVGLRIENVAPGATDALHAYYEALHKASCIQPLNPSPPPPPKTTTDSSSNVTGETSTCSEEENKHHRHHYHSNNNNNNGNQGAVRFNLVDVNLSTLARHLPPPFDKIPLKITSFFQQQHEQVQQVQQQSRSRDNDNNNNNNNRVKTNTNNSDKDKDGGGVGTSTAVDTTTTTSQTSSRMRSVLAGSFQTANRRIGHDIDNAVHGVENAYHGVREATFVAGNCAQWTSKGLAFCGLIRRNRIFPKSILIGLLEDEIFSGRTNNVNLVVYEQVKHAQKKTDWGGPYEYIKSAYVHPLRPIRNVWYDKPEEFANAIVSVPYGTTEAIVKTQKPSKQPQKIFLVISVASAVVPAAIMVGLVDHVGPIGPISAAVWIGLNYWLH